MKGRVKQLTALIALVVLVFSSVLTATASNSKLIQRKTNTAGASLAHSQATFDSEDGTGYKTNASFDFVARRYDDTVTLYQLVKYEATAGNKSLTVDWVQPVKDFINANDEFKNDEDYASPSKLGWFEAAKDDSAAEAARIEADQTAKSQKVLKLLNAIKAEKQAAGDTAVTLDKLTKVAVVSGLDICSYNKETAKLVIDTAKCNGSSNIVRSGAVSGLTVTCTAEDANTFQKAGENGSNQVPTYSFTGVPFGLYFINITNDKVANEGGYQPVLANLMPEQTGPSGNWYIDDTQIFTAKNEGAGIKKTINGSHSDIIRVGEVVTFTVEADVPVYPKNSDGSYKFTKFTLFDDMAEGYSLIATSAKLTYFDSEGREYHPTAAMVPAGVGSQLATDPTTNTYEAQLISEAFAVTSSADSTGKALFYFIPENTEKTVVSIFVSEDGKLTRVSTGNAIGTKDPTTGIVTYTINQTLVNSVNSKLTAANKITYAPNTMTVAERSNALLGIDFKYNTLMNEAAYTETDSTATGFVRNANFTVPSKVLITYDAIVNDNIKVGTGDNTNKVYLKYYVDDTGSTDPEPTDTVHGYTYGAQLVKVDGDAYENYKNASAEEKAAMIADPTKTPFLSGAKFDIYRYDTTYCNTAATTKATEPAKADYSAYTFYDDANNEFDAANNSDVAGRYAAARTNFLGAGGEFYKAVVYDITQNGAAEDRDPLVVGPNVKAAAGLVGNYNTAATFTNKYNYTGIYNDADTVGMTQLRTLRASNHINMLTDYMFTNITSDTRTYDNNDDFTGDAAKFVQYRPVWMEDGCKANPTGHWHIEAYSIFMDGIESDASTNEEGIKVKGLDPNKYLMIETAAPDGYNKLTNALYFEINKYAEGSDELEAANNEYTGFISDVYEHEEANDSGEKTYYDNNENGFYPFTVNNYKGLVLPSTGGMGTLLFIIIGIATMVVALMVILIRNNKLAKSVTSFILMMAMVVTVFAGTAFRTDAVTTINLSGGSSDGAAFGAEKAVSNGTTSFKIHLREANDTIEVYRIGIVEDAEGGGFKELQWSDRVNNYKYNFETDTGIDFPNTPAVYADTTKTDAATQALWLEWLYDTRNASGITNDKLADSNITKSKDNSYITIKGDDVYYGMYLIKAKNASLNKEYQVIAVSAYPEQGPLGGWYITGIPEASLKYADADIDKKINDADSDVVRKGETVTFDVFVQVPDYQAVRADGSIIEDKESTEYKTYPWNTNYKLAISDVMSEAFALDSNSTLTITYLTEDPAKDYSKYNTADAIKTVKDNEANHENPSYFAANGSVTVDTIFAKAYDSTSQSGVAKYVDATDKDGNVLYNVVVKNSSTAWTCTWYLYNTKNGSIKKLVSNNYNTIGTALPTTPPTDVVTAYKTAIGKTTIGTISRAADEDVINVTPNVQTLKDNKVTAIKLTYTAVVTDECLPGVETNINTASLWYRRDIGGNYEKKDDVVNAYTYAFNLIKTDGESASTYLKDAQFALYKEAYLYVPNAVVSDADDNQVLAGTAISAEPTSADWKKYIFSAGAKNGEYEKATVPTKPGAEESDPAVELTKLSDLQSATNHDVYFRYIEVPAPDSTCEATGCNMTAAHYHVAVYERMAFAEQTTGGHKDIINTNGKSVIYSVDNENGVKINGLEDASYVLIEEAPPAGGYNELTEAMRFEIQRITDDMRIGETDSEGVKTEIGAKLEAANAAYTTDATFYSAIECDEDTTMAVAKVVGGELKYYQGYSDGVYQVNVKNFKGLTLPSTGGMGTLLFTIIGILLMLVVLTLVILRNKKVNYQ